jgi:tRNA (guanine37-N1)-methyltransferase
MKIDIISLFPKFFGSPFNESIIRRAREKGLIDIRVHDLRDYTTDPHRVTDDYPYGGVTDDYHDGGGAGMVMKPEPIFAAGEALRAAGGEQKVILLSPKGRVWNQELARSFSRLPGLIMICGRYEGEDERVRLALVEEEISVGDYVLTGGEAAAVVLVESLARLVPGVVGAAESVEQDSFSEELLDHPHYTRPAVFRGMAVPEVLLSGNHAEIRRWRRREALRTTLEKRPDLLEGRELSADDRRHLEELRREYDSQ